MYIHIYSILYRILIYMLIRTWIREIFLDLHKCWTLEKNIYIKKKGNKSHLYMKRALKKEKKGELVCFSIFDTF